MMPAGLVNRVARYLEAAAILVNEGVLPEDFSPAHAGKLAATFEQDRRQSALLRRRTPGPVSVRRGNGSWRCESRGCADRLRRASARAEHVRTEATRSAIDPSLHCVKPRLSAVPQSTGESSLDRNARVPTRAIAV